MSSTLDNVNADLEETSKEVVEVQASLIDALERRADTETVKLLEQQLTEATEKRDDLIGTKEYIIRQERAIAVRDGQKLSTLLYFSQWPESFTPAEIPDLVFQSNARNEKTGITGVIFALRGAFASYLEGTPEALNKLTAKLKRDARHIHFSIVDRQDNVQGGRKFPRNGLMLVHADERHSVHQAHPVAAALWQMCQQLGVTDFVSPINRVTRGRHNVNVAGPVQVNKSFMIGVTCFTSFFTKVPSLEAQSYVLNDVVNIVNDVIRESNSMFEGYTVTPHQEFLLAVAAGQAPEVIRRAVEIFDRINAESRTVDYCPIVVVHYGSFESILDGTCTVVGPSLRYVRQLVTLSRQEGFVVTVSESCGDEAQREGIVEGGCFLFDKRPDHVFFPTRFAETRWEALLKEREEAALTKQRLANHIEGPGEIDIDAAIGVPAGKKPVFPTTIDDVNAKPVRGLPTEEELRADFELLRPNADGTILRESFEAYYFGQDTLGVNERPEELAALLRTTRTDGREDHVTFQQFCVVAFRRFR